MQMMENDGEEATATPRRHSAFETNMAAFAARLRRAAEL